MIKVKHGLVSGIALATVLLAACGADKKAEEAKLDTLEAKLSYMIGTDAASNFKRQGIALDPAALAMAISDVQSDKESRLSQEDIQQVIADFQAKAQAAAEVQKAEQELQFNEVAEGNKKESEAFLLANAAKEGVQSTASGLQYKVITDAKGAKPAVSDTVVVHYKGTLIDGTEFDSSYGRGEPVTFPLTGVIPGWTEALQLMPKGSKFELYIPSDMAYGLGGSGAIGPNQALIFEVELLDILAPEAAK